MCIRDRLCTLGERTARVATRCRAEAASCGRGRALQVGRQREKAGATARSARERFVLLVWKTFEKPHEGVKIARDIPPGQTLSPPLLVTAANPLARKPAVLVGLDCTAVRGDLRSSSKSKSSAATAATTTTAVSTTGTACTTTASTTNTTSTTSTANTASTIYS